SLVDPAGIDHVLIADQEDLRCADARCAFADLAQGSPAEDDFGGDEFADVHGISSESRYDGPAKIHIYRGERGGRGGNPFIGQRFLRDLRDLVLKKPFLRLYQSITTVGLKSFHPLISYLRKSFFPPF